MFSKKIDTVKILLLQLCCLGFSFSMGQYLPDLQYDKDLGSYVCNKPQKINIDTLLKLTQNNNLKDTALLACCHHQIGVFYFGKEEYFSSIKHNKLAINLRRSFDDGLLWKSLRNLGTCYENFQRYDKMTMYYEEALTYYQPNDKNKVIMLKNFAQALAKIGDISRAENEILQAINIGNNENINENEIAKVHSMMAEIILNAVDSLNIKKAIYHANEAIKLSEKRKTKIAALNELGRAYDLSGFYEDAITQYEKALSYSNNKLVQSKAKNNIAAAYEKLGNYKKAISLFNESLKLKLDYYEQKKHHFDYAINHRNLGENYFALQQYDTALLHYQKAQINLTDKFRNNDIFQNPNPKDMSVYVFSNPEMVQVLHLKAKAAYKHYQQNKNIKYLNLAQQTYQTLIDFHNKLQQDITTENSRLFQSKNILEYLEQALEIAYTKQNKNDFDAEAIFRLMEKNKATVLFQSMNEADALQFANLPDSLLEQEKDLKIAIAHYERQVNDAKINEDTVKIINDLDNTLFENKEKYHRLIKTLENNYPKYYQLKYQQNQTTLSQVKNQLDEASALLEYFVGEKYIYILSIQKNKSQLYQIEKPTNWNKRLNDFVAFFKPAVLNRDELHSTGQLNKFTELSSYLFELLLQQPLNDLEENITQLQIIPDAELNYLPFDVLLYKKPDTTDNLTFGALPYLIKQKAIGYAYSANLWLDNLQTKPLNKPIAYGGYACIYLGENYADLPKPRQQVEATAEMFDGISYLANSATKSAFIKDTSSYKITQFAMHGVVNDTLPLNSHLVFTPTNGKDTSFKLYASDLYNKKLNTELAILNACNTGTGQLQKGEGVMSLSRAFTYAGCPSLMMSLWSIPDVSSAEVLDVFFINLKNGATKDVALQQAKLNFLETSEKTHPVYWAGLVAVGNLEALDLNTDTELFLGLPVWLYFTLIALFIGGGLFTIKKFW